MQRENIVRDREKSVSIGKKIREKCDQHSSFLTVSNAIIHCNLKHFIGVLEPPQQRGPVVRGFVEMPRIPPKQ